MSKKILLFTLLLLSTWPSFSQKYHRISSQISKEKLNDLFAKGLEIDHFHFENGGITAEVSDNDIKVFENNGVKFKYLIKDLEKNIPKINKEIDKKAGRNLRTSATPSNFALGTYGGFFTMTEFHNNLDQMRLLYPNLISAKTSIGTTVEGRPVYMVKISDNPDADEPESELFLNAVHHAREPMSLSQLIYFMWHVLENYGTDQELTTLVNSTEMYIIPMVNPDGYQYNIGTNPSGGGMWRKNRKNNGNGTFGVDINRNYGYMWGFDNTGSSPTTSSSTYRGPSAFSEPETQIVRDFCNGHNFVASFDFHSSGNYLIYPYGYQINNINPEAGLFSSLATYLTAENAFKTGNAYQTVSYVANGAGDDWKYGEQTTKNKIYSFTPEIGTSTDGFYPAQSRIIPLCESTLQMNRKILKLSTKYAALSVTNPGTSSTTTGNLSFSVQNFGLRNPSYNLSVSSSSPYVTSVGTTQTISAMNVFQTINGQFSYSLDTNTPVGTSINFTITLDNGHSPQTQTVSLTYDCAAPTSLAATGIGLSNATLSWNTVGGATSYIFNYKTNSTSTWSSDSTITGTSIGLNGLNSETTYNFRVKTNSCANFSQTNFTTLGACGNPGTPVVSNINPTGATLTWTAGNNASSYQIQYKLTSSSTWVTAVAANTSLSYSLTGLTASSAYDVRIRTNCSSGNSAYVNSTFTTSSLPAVTYCASKGNNTQLMWMDYFRLSNITRSSGADAGYYNGTALVANMTKGTTNTVYFSAGYASTRYRVYWKVWIDYNGNGSFNDTGEQIVNTNTTGTGNYTVSFSVPQTAITGTTRIRVSMKYNATPNSCETFSYGEVEDYTVNISPSVNSMNVRESVEIPLFQSDLTLKVFPNPSSEEIMVDLSGFRNQKVSYDIINPQGMIIKSEKLNYYADSFGVDIRNLSSGAYLIQIKGQTKKASSRFIKL